MHMHVVESAVQWTRGLMPNTKRAAGSAHACRGCTRAWRGDAACFAPEGLDGVLQAVTRYSIYTCSARKPLRDKALAMLDLDMQASLQHSRYRRSELSQPSARKCHATHSARGHTLARALPRVELPFLATQVSDAEQWLESHASHFNYAIQLLSRHTPSGCGRSLSPFTPPRLCAAEPLGLLPPVAWRAGPADRAALSTRCPCWGGSGARATAGRGVTL